MIAAELINELNMITRGKRANEITQLGQVRELLVKLVRSLLSGILLGFSSTFRRWENTDSRDVVGVFGNNVLEFFKYQFARDFSLLYSLFFSLMNKILLLKYSNFDRSYEFLCDGI